MHSSMERRGGAGVVLAYRSWWRVPIIPVQSTVPLAAIYTTVATASHSPPIAPPNCASKRRDCIPRRVAAPPCHRNAYRPAQPSPNAATGRWRGLGRVREERLKILTPGREPRRRPAPTIWLGPQPTLFCLHARSQRKPIRSSLCPPHPTHSSSAARSHGGHRPV